MPNIICVVGPTATGKTALAVALCQALDGEVLSCDSMQLYRGMDIGTAKPSPAEMQGVVHHMLNVCSPQEDYSVSRYVEQADPILQDILARGKTAVIAGGTGLYVDGLIAGRQYAPFPATGRREALEALADQAGIQPLLERLAEIDPESAARLHPADRKRIIRALEVYEETGQTITQHNRQTQAIPPKYQPIWLGLDFQSREALYRRIDLRVEQMMAQGLEAEVRALLAAGVPREATAMQAIGYKEIAAAILGACTLEQAVAQVQQSSRRYAKRQRTWFRRNERVHWLLQPDTPQPEAVLAQALEIIGKGS